MNELKRRLLYLSMISVVVCWCSVKPMLKRVSKT